MSRATLTFSMEVDIASRPRPLSAMVEGKRIAHVVVDGQDDVTVTFEDKSFYNAIGLSPLRMSFSERMSADDRGPFLLGMPMPWAELVADGWSIVGMNHYYVGGVRHLYVAVVKGERCVKAEGPDDHHVFSLLYERARNP